MTLSLLLCGTYKYKIRSSCFYSLKNKLLIALEPSVTSSNSRRCDLLSGVRCFLRLNNHRFNFLMQNNSWTAQDFYCWPWRWAPSSSAKSYQATVYFLTMTSSLFWQAVHASSTASSCGCWFSASRTVIMSQERNYASCLRFFCSSGRSKLGVNRGK